MRSSSARLASGFMTKSLKTPNQGFSLTELLVVIAIITTLTGVSMVAFKNIGGGQGVSGAVDIAASLTMNARLESTEFRRGALLVIDNYYDASQPETYLRRMAILQGVEADGETEWQLTSKPIFLPKNVFLLTDYSDGFRTDQSFDFQTREPQDGSAGSPVMYLEFDGSGHLKTDLVTGSNDTRLVFGQGTLNPTGEVTFSSTQLAGRQGFLLRQNGRPIFFEDLDQMTQTSD